MVEPETFFTDTSDGWRLQLTRVTGNPRKELPPVLMLHGFGANGYCLLHPGSPSLGHHLASGGRDVWLLEFRGTSSSRHPAGASAFERISVDDKILRDLPAGLTRVQAETGADAVDLVAFSLGGTIAYAFLSHFGEQSIRRWVALAAPLRYRLPSSASLLRQLARFRHVRQALPGRIPMRGFTQLGARTNIVFPAHRHFNLANVRRDVLLGMMRHGTEDASLTELLQLTHWSQRRKLTSLDGRIDFGARLKEVRRPLLLIGGSADRHVSRDALTEVLRRVGADEQQLLMVGCNTGAARDYGHTDLLLGARAATEVFPHVDAWLSSTRGVEP